MRRLYVEIGEIMPNVAGAPAARLEIS